MTVVHRGVDLGDTLASANGGDGAEYALVSVGGGLGSFAVIDQLRTRGVRPEALAVVTEQALPFESFRSLARNSQLADDDRLRSDSASRIDNCWGFPSYAVTESVRTRRPGPAVRAMAEPLLADYYRPLARDVYRGIERECARIGWSTMLRAGRCVEVTPRPGGYEVTYEQAGDGGRVRTVLRCRAVHLGVGHPALGARTDPGALGPATVAVHAYEPHDTVYDEVVRRADAIVVVRGAGIVASQVLHRLMTDRRAHGVDTAVIHLVRPGTWFAPDPFIDHQPFSAPRAAFGGQLHRALGRAEPGARRQLAASLRRTTSPEREVWERELETARAEGWFVEMVRDEVPDCDVVIDCTGFAPAPDADPALAGLVERLGGTMAVDESFALEGSRLPEGGAVYVSGALAADGPVGPVDSFWGLQLAAQRIADALAARGECRRLGATRSARAWWRWARGRTP